MACPIENPISAHSYTDEYLNLIPFENSHLAINLQWKAVELSKNRFSLSFPVVSGPSMIEFHSQIAVSWRLML